MAVYTAQISRVDGLTRGPYGEVWDGSPKWNGGAKRDGAKRVGLWCRHYHTTPEEAMECARRSVEQKGGASS